MSLKGLLQKTPDVALMREMIGFAAQRLMKLEAGGLTGASTARRRPSGWLSAWLS